MRRSEWFGLLMLLAAAAVCLFALGCQKVSGGGHSLPEVSAPESFDGSRFITCQDWQNCLPDKELALSINLVKQEHLCFVGGMCFYRCPKDQPVNWPTTTD